MGKETPIIGENIPTGESCQFSEYSKASRIASNTTEQMMTGKITLEEYMEAINSLNLNVDMRKAAHAVNRN